MDSKNKLYYFDNPLWIGDREYVIDTKEEGYQEPWIYEFNSEGVKTLIYGVQKGSKKNHKSTTYYKKIASMGISEELAREKIQGYYIHGGQADSGLPTAWQCYATHELSKDWQ